MNSGTEPFAFLNTPVHRLDPRVKIISSFAFILICVSTPPQNFMAFAGYAAFLIAMILLSHIEPWKIFRRSLIVIPFVVMISIFLPFMHAGNISPDPALPVYFRAHPGWMIFWNVLIKSYLGIVTIILLTLTTSFPDMLKGLEQLRVPRLFILMLGLSYRYLFVLRDEALRMKRARDSRGYSGRWIWHAGVIGQMIGTLFLRSYERGERVYQAMLARGFEGLSGRASGPSLRLADYLLMASSISFLLLIRYAA